MGSPRGRHGCACAHVVAQRPPLQLLLNTGRRRGVRAQRCAALPTTASRTFRLPKLTLCSLPPPPRPPPSTPVCAADAPGASCSFALGLPPPQASGPQDASSPQLPGSGVLPAEARRADLEPTVLPTAPGGQEEGPLKLSEADAVALRGVPRHAHPHSTHSGHSPALLPPPSRMEKPDGERR